MKDKEKDAKIKLGNYGKGGKKEKVERVKTDSPERKGKTPVAGERKEKARKGKTAGL